MNVNTPVNARMPALDCIDAMKGGALSMFILFIWCLRIEKLIWKNKIINSDQIFTHVNYVNV